MEQRFATRSTLTRILEGTSIQIVPLLHQLDSLPSELELREMVQQKSKYTQGPLEGVYVKVEDEIEVKARGKVSCFARFPFVSDHIADQQFGTSLSGCSTWLHLR